MIELDLIQTFPQTILATDEVGRGPLGGPVVIGTILIEVRKASQLKTLISALKKRGITDSKKITPKKRAEILVQLGINETNFREQCTLQMAGLDIHYLTWEVDHETIDRENILAASLLGMRESALHMVGDRKDISILIDGNAKLRWPDKRSPWTEFPIVKGDSKSVLIGLASILAKEKRDAHMKEMHVLYPEYGFDSHAGYPTAFHRKAIEEHGPSPIHRKTFKGVKEFIR